MSGSSRRFVTGCGLAAEQRFVHAAALGQQHAVGRHDAAFRHAHAIAHAQLMDADALEGSVLELPARQTAA